MLFVQSTVYKLPRGLVARARSRCEHAVVCSATCGDRADLDAPLPSRTRCDQSEIACVVAQRPRHLTELAKPPRARGSQTRDSQPHVRRAPTRTARRRDDADVFASSRRSTNGGTSRRRARNRALDEIGEADGRPYARRHQDSIGERIIARRGVMQLPSSEQREDCGHWAS